MAQSAEEKEEEVLVLVERDDVALHLMLVTIIVARDDGVVVVVDGKEVKAEAGTTKTFMAGNKNNTVVVNDIKLAKKAILNAARVPPMLAIVVRTLELWYLSSLMVDVVIVL